MKLSHTLLARCSAMILLAGAAGVHAQSYVNLNVGGALAPGVFGEISIGSAPPPPVLNPAPVVVVQGGPPRPPAYLYVPEAHRRDWAHHCAEYHACDRPVHFVEVNEKNRWWDHHEAREHHEMRREDERHEEHRDERRDERRDDHR